MGRAPGHIRSSTCLVGISTDRCRALRRSPFTKFLATLAICSSFCPCEVHPAGARYGYRPESVDLYLLGCSVCKGWVPLNSRYALLVITASSIVGVGTHNWCHSRRRLARDVNNVSLTISVRCSAGSPASGRCLCGLEVWHFISQWKASNWLPASLAVISYLSRSAANTPSTASACPRSSLTLARDTCSCRILSSSVDCANSVIPCLKLTLMDEI